MQRSRRIASVAGADPRLEHETLARPAFTGPAHASRMRCRNCPPSHAITPYPLQTACGSLPVSYFRPLQLNVLDPVAAAPCGGCMLPVFRAASTSKPSPCAPPAPCCTAARSRLKRYRRSRGSLSASRRPARAWTPPLMNLGRCPSADLAPCVYHVHSLRRSSHVKKGVRYPVHTYSDPSVTKRSHVRWLQVGIRLRPSLPRYGRTYQIHSPSRCPTQHPTSCTHLPLKPHLPSRFARLSHR